MNKKEKIVMSISIAFSFVFGIMKISHAMHIMEGYLPAGHCIAWGALCIPFIVAGFIKINKMVKEDRRALTLFAMAGAFVFVLSSLKIPSVTGSCSHMTGTGLGAILFGATPVSILGLIVLIFQAILLAHGGLTTLGANTFSMAIAGPFVTAAVYGLCKKSKMNRNISVFLAAALGDLFTYCITSLQLAIAYPSEAGGVIASAGKFLALFATTQVPLAIIEGILSVLIMMALTNYAKPELRAIGHNVEA